MPLPHAIPYLIVIEGHVLLEDRSFLRLGLMHRLDELAEQQPGQLAGIDRIRLYHLPCHQGVPRDRRQSTHPRTIAGSSINQPAKRPFFQGQHTGTWKRCQGSPQRRIVVGT